MTSTVIANHQAAGRARSVLREDRVLSIVAQGGVLALNLVASVIIARSVGPDATGAFAAVARTSAFLLSFVSLSYAHGLAQVGANRGARAASASWSGALLLAVPQTLVGGALLTVVFVFVAQLPEAHTGVLVAWYAVSLGAQFVIVAGQHILRGLQAFAAFNANRLGQAGTWLAACLALFAVDRVSLATVGAAWFASQVATLVAVVSAVRRRGVRLVRHPEVDEPLRFGLRAHIGIVGRDTAPYLDQLLVAGLLGTAALGLYVPASTFSGLVLVVGIAMSFVIQPRIAAASPEERPRVCLRLVGQAAWASLAVGVVCAVASSWVVPFVYGQAYEDSGRLGGLLSLAVVLDSTSMAVVCAFIGLGMPGRASAIQALGTSVVVVSLLAFLGEGGVDEAPMAMLVAYGTTCAAAVGCLWRALPAHNRRAADLLLPVTVPRSKP